MKLTKFGILILTTLFWSITPLIAQQETEDLMEMSLDELMNITVTASMHEQKITDAPALVTVITGKQIEEMGARTLLDVLLTVPGFNHIQDVNEHVVSVRGVFATTNQKFLLLRDGHRLNEAMFENIEPDYSISLANIKRIEIVRGPGASLYGNAALTAVINIITIDAEDVDGYKVYGSLGNYGQSSIEGLYGKKWGEASLLVFGKFANVEGEEVELTAEEDYNSANPIAGKMYVDKFPMNFDLGFKFIDGGITMSGAIRRSNYAQPKGNGGKTIDWDNQWHNMEQVWEYRDLDLKYQGNIKGFDLTLRHFLTNCEYYSWQLLATSRDRLPDGELFQLAVSTTRLGLEYSAVYAYDQGDILAGFKAERWKLDDSYLLRNKVDSSVVARQEEPLLPENTEYNTAFFVQAQHAILPSLKINVGARYDNYEGFGGSFNPRAAVILTPVDMLTLKAIYSRSFQAPSYFYREANPGLGYGSTSELEPEKMQVIQLAARVSPSSNWFAEVSGFYNYLEDLISKDSNLKIYRNFTEMTVKGLELETEYSSQELSGFANYTYLVPVTDKTDEGLVKEETLKDIPVHTVNLGITYRPLPKVSTNLTVNWTGENYSAIPADSDNILDSKAVANFTAVLKDIPQNATISLSVHNLFDLDYKLGGKVPAYPQQGRWISATVGYKF